MIKSICDGFDTFVRLFELFPLCDNVSFRARRDRFHDRSPLLFELAGLFIEPMFGLLLLLPLFRSLLPDDEPADEPAADKSSCFGFDNDAGTYVDGLDGRVSFGD